MTTLAKFVNSSYLVLYILLTNSDKESYNFEAEELQLVTNQTTWAIDVVDKIPLRSRCFASIGNQHNSLYRCFYFVDLTVSAFAKFLQMRDVRFILDARYTS